MKGKVAMGREGYCGVWYGRVGNSRVWVLAG